jgi:hypothetical protein
MTPTDELRNDMRNAFNAGKKYLLAIQDKGGVRTAYAEAPALLGAYVVEQLGAEGIESYTRGNTKFYEIRNDHPRLRDGWFLQPIIVSFVKVN